MNLRAAKCKRISARVFAAGGATPRPFRRPSPSGTRDRRAAPMRHTAVS